MARYELRLRVLDNHDKTETLDIDIEVRAPQPQSAFHIGGANFRFSYNINAIHSPTKVLALDFEGVKGTGSDGNPISYFPAHNMSGSTGNIVSYNTFYSFGEGSPVDDQWQPVGRIRFQVRDLNQALNLTWLFEGDGAGQGTIITQINTFDPQKGRYTLISVKAEQEISHLRGTRFTDNNAIYAADTDIR